MLKKALLCGLLATGLVFGSIGISQSADPGPEQLVLKSSDSDKKPPAVFPHKTHQEAMECGECHHSMVDGKQGPYTEGMKIQKCVECHNSEVLAGKKKGKHKLDTYKGAAHGNCVDCHKTIAKEDSSKKKLKSCKTCHVKQ